MQNRLSIPRPACGVCGSREVRLDVVEQILLAECPRCVHRWTAPLRAPAHAVGAAVHAEVANAA